MIISVYLCHLPRTLTSTKPKQANVKLSVARTVCMVPEFSSGPGYGGLSLLLLVPVLLDAPLLLYSIAHDTEHTQTHLQREEDARTRNSSVTRLVLLCCTIIACVIARVQILVELVFLCSSVVPTLLADGLLYSIAHGLVHAGVPCDYKQAAGGVGTTVCCRSVLLLLIADRHRCCARVVPLKRSRYWAVCSDSHRRLRKDNPVSAPKLFPPSQ